MMTQSQSGYQSKTLLHTNFKMTDNQKLINDLKKIKKELKNSLKAKVYNTTHNNYTSPKSIKSLKYSNLSFNSSATMILKHRLETSKSKSKPKNDTFNKEEFFKPKSQLKVFKKNANDIISNTKSSLSKLGLTTIKNKKILLQGSKLAQSLSNIITQNKKK